LLQLLLRCFARLQLRRERQRAASRAAKQPPRMRVHLNALVPSWPGLSRPPRLFFATLQFRGRRDKPGDDDL